VDKPTLETTPLQSSREDVRIAYLTALAIVVHIAESALPSPLPGVKPGLANIITIAVLCRFGWTTAAWVSLLRTLVGSLLIGTFLSPTFFLSFAGALAAVTILAPASRLPAIGPVGLSVLASLAHMAAQFGVAYAMFIPHPALLGLLPVLMTAALIFGLVNGRIALSMLRHLDSPNTSGKTPGNTA
jgi:heptaprenyl diphosphate synthase